MNESLIPLEGVQGCVGFLFLAYQVLSRLDVENKVSRYGIWAAPFADPWDHSSRLVYLSRRLMCLLCQGLPWEAGVLCSIWNDTSLDARQHRAVPAWAGGGRPGEESSCGARWLQSLLQPTWGHFPVRRAVLPSWGHAGNVQGALPSPSASRPPAMRRAVRWGGTHPEQKVSFKRFGCGEPLEFGASAAGWGPSPGPPQGR